MIQVTPQMRILLAIEPVDFRKGIDGLVAPAAILARFQTAHDQPVREEAQGRPACRALRVLEVHHLATDLTAKDLHLLTLIASL